MSSIQNVGSALPASNVPAAVIAKVPAAPPQTLPVDTVTLSGAGLAASRNYLQSVAQLAETPPQQVRLLAADGSSQAQAALAREAYSRILFS